MKNIIRILGLTIVFLASVFTYDTFRNKPLGENFTLTASNGKIVTEADIRSKSSVIFFGYTMCPDTCPTTLVDLNRWLTAIGPNVDKLNVWFVTVDPERDTPEVLREYLSNFTDKIIGISGDPNAVHKMVSSFNIVAEKVPGTDDDNYTYNHTAAIFLLKKGGKLAGVIPYNVEENNNKLKDDIAITRLKKLVSNSAY
ncbi:sco1/2 family protein [Bartonella clarridgeiae 73]|uniref:Sco1/2 family protein n=1 Tax=Bartonella clarridgeiae (strain CCUG 45776 / CIP 104772 / 73) TaxID=696125 RepID=E6YIH7_BARC7|nr:SCO family protein [Bartonella clarridgeiae]WCR54769.1 MAG: Cytochrome oxidase biogenesis protein Sco1/SenC/PrrC thiol-disulfide reductase involved in Cu(I) insertion into CoxII Cu(A) center [Bartonella clarridgeiae]CBI76665.1 sco1/2 family protein [Bartonella clarridgeiae 73]